MKEDENQCIKCSSQDLILPLKSMLPLGVKMYLI